MKVALIHDSLHQYGNAERILEVLHRIYPDAPIYTAFVDRRPLANVTSRFAHWDIRPTIVDRLPRISRYFHAYRLGLPTLWEAFDLSTYDLVISSSSEWMSQAVLTRSHTLHVSYCHTPPRFLWEPPASGGVKHWINTHLRQYDFYAAQRVDRFVAPSESVARRIRKFYRRPVEVIPPPVQVQGSGSAGDQYYLYVGSLNQESEVELAIAACTQINRPLWVVGTGDQLERLKQQAGANVRFLGAVPQDELVSIYADAIALICPSSLADFDFAVVEALGCGVPAIVSKHSGLSEVVLDYRTGLLFNDPTPHALGEAIFQFEKLRFSSSACIERAEEFAESVFVSKFKWFVAKAMDDHEGVKDEGMRG
jgi:glycosyltransferase involved in cell wall biosynthesis